jgi:hypothetical protein
VGIGVARPASASAGNGMRDLEPLRKENMREV